MSDLFGNNYFFLYIFACITIFNYSSFKENQKIIILYFTTFGMGFLKIFNITTTILFLMISTFLYLEILTPDEYKMKIVTKIRYKILDYLFLITFQYGIFYIIFSIFLTSHKLSEYLSVAINCDFETGKTILQFLSVLLFVLGIMKITSEKFKIKNINELVNIFTPSINMVPFNKINPEIFDMLIDMEDSTYRVRKNTYNFFSFEFLSYKISQIKKIKTVSQKYIQAREYIKNTQHIRGYSTIEIQLMRTIGIIYGYDIIIIRKIYEITYTTIFLKSLRNYYLKNIYANRNKYKEFLLYIYLKNVNTLVEERYYSKITDFIGNREEDWSKEVCFIAFSGLPHKSVTLENILDLNPNIIKKYKLDESKLLEIMREKRS